ncbi:hypothetical protein C2G38_2168814 [Gigaspora rosea]|uniref:Uncharacterized protein n=1 Tax=Gigaspora rosea TaxID=44941 RepID=A0A397VSN4_9GLOM|nr:hypothetical protein C2G38_2168814 [Gigaspora rosea]
MCTQGQFIGKKHRITIDLNQKYVRIQKKHRIANEIIKINGVIKNLKTICEILEGTVGLNNVSSTIRDEIIKLSLILNNEKNKNNVLFKTTIKSSLSEDFEIQIERHQYQIITEAQICKYLIEELNNNNMLSGRQFSNLKRLLPNDLEVQTQTVAAVHFKALEALIELVEISQWKKDAEENINKLQTILTLSNTNVENLTYDNPLASGIICNKSELVKNLPQDCQEEFQTSNNNFRKIEESSSMEKPKEQNMLWK